MLINKGYKKILTILSLLVMPFLWLFKGDFKLPKKTIIKL